MFSQSAEFYEAIYEAKGKKYDEEIRHLIQILARHGYPTGGTLLEVACGTGSHIRHLRDHFKVQGLDREPHMLAIARERLPEIPFHCQDMRSFEIDQSFDIILCLFSAIGYANTLEDLLAALRTMGRHLNPGGVLIVEPWISPAEYVPGGVFSVVVDKPSLKIARMNVNEVRGNVSVLKFHYLVATPDGVQHMTELHELGLYTKEQYLEAFRAAGLHTVFEPEGLIGRGIYIARRA